MKVVYLAGPLRASNQWERELHIRLAESLSYELWLKGFAVICPHTMVRFFDGALDDEVGIKGDLEILSRCDAVFLIPGWRRSEGTLQEQECAMAKGIPVFDIVNDLLKWRDKTDG